MSKEITTTTDQQVKFLNETLQRLDSFKRAVARGEIIMEDAMFQDEHNAPTIDEAGGRNIYMRIDYHLGELDAE